MNLNPDPRSHGNQVTDCSYCGLPLSHATSNAENAYCCVGCRVAAAVTGATGDQGEARWMATSLGVSVFCTMNVVMMTMALWSYVASPSTPFELGLADFLRYSALMFTAPVLLLLGRPLAMNALSQLKSGVLSTDLLLLTGVVAAYLVSAVATFRSAGHVYFEVVCVILVLVTFGRWLEASGRMKATTTLDDLERLIPETVCRIDATGRSHAIPLAQVEVGHLLRVLPGERIPCDGRVSRGRGVVDTQFFTGEFVAVEKQPGDEVLGGSLNLDGDLTIEVTAPAAEGALGRLVDAVRQARLSKGHIQLLADRWSMLFFPIIASLSLLTLLWHGLNSGWESGLLAALSVTLIACPCALALATPLAIWVSLATAARRGVLFRSGEAMERMAAVRAVRWDKTGTLTTGTPVVLRLVCEDAEKGLVESVAAKLVAGSNHIYSAAIRRHLDEAIPPESNAPVESIPGRGVQSELPDVGRVFLGSLKFMQESGLQPRPELTRLTTSSEMLDSSIVLVGWDGRIRGAFVLEEELREDALQAIEACRELRLDVAVLTGDRRDRMERWQRTLGVPITAELLPEQKLEQIRQAHTRFGSVAMVGDGLNDAPSLAAADVGVAMGCGADVSRDSADVCLLPNRLSLVPWSVRHAQKTVHVIRQNLGWSFGYNGVGVVVAMCGWLHPALAAVLMVVSSLFVLGNSLRLQGDDASDSKSAPDGTWALGVGAAIPMRETET